MKKWLILGIIIFFHFAYLEWGSNQQRFVFEAEWEIIQKGIQDITQIIHPFILIPFFGILLLIITLFQKSPSRWLIFVGAGSMSLLILMLLFIGIISFKIKMITAALPFILTASYLFYVLHKERLYKVNR